MRLYASKARVRVAITRHLGHIQGREVTPRVLIMQVCAIEVGDIDEIFYPATLSYRRVVFDCIFSGL